MKFFLVALCAAFVLSLSGCSLADGQNADKDSRTWFVFGTLATVTVVGDDRKTVQDALDADFERLCEIEKIFSYTDPESELSRLNAAAPSGEPITVSEELFSLIQEGLRYSEETGGAFDITLGALIDLWGVDGDNPRVPSRGEIESLLPYIGYENVILDAENRTVAFSNKHVKIHLGGIAKGYAAQRLALADNVNSVIADLGGDIVFAGEPPNKTAWRIGIADPANPGGIVMTLKLPREDGCTAIMTSGTYQRFFERDGKRYHHILDPKTGYPASSGIVSATVMMTRGSGAEADALATAIIVEGEEFARERVEQAVLITDDGEIIMIGVTDVVYD
ncbi:MAG: FAD:protein FMN transferase [Oscillospiraceae bacterium]|jgi:thiamine biosynthesis lipoprotein|nr:FAD:protein FMN transferase [Oscillospiraceae bacterium]